MLGFMPCTRAMSEAAGPVTTLRLLVALLPSSGLGRRIGLIRSQSRW